MQNDNPWTNYFNEEFMSEMNVITPEMLGKVRMMLYVVFDFKDVEVKYSVDTQHLEVIVKFKFLSHLFRRRKVVQRIVRELHEKFPNLDITVTEKTNGRGKER